MKNTRTAVVLIALLASAICLWFLLPDDRSRVSVPTIETAAAEIDEVEANLTKPVAIDPPVRIEADSRVAALQETPPEAAKPKESRPAPKAAPQAKPEGGQLNVTVLAPDGKPASDARVSVQPWIRNPLERQNARREQTDARGQAQVQSIPWGLVYATASLKGFAMTASEPFDLSPSHPTGSVNIQLCAGGAVEGHLMDVDGAPAAGIQLSLHLKHWPGQVKTRRSGYLKQERAGSDGYFRFEHLPAGPYTLYTRAKGADLTRVPEQSLELEVVDGQTTQVTFDDLRGSYVEVTGLVLRNGEPVSEARVNVSYADRSRDRIGRKATTDENGRFKMILDEPNDYRFQVSGALGSRGSAFHLETVPPGSTHEFVIAFETGSIAGHVYDGDGNPAAKVALTAFGKSSDAEGSTTISRAISDDSGAFEFASALDGTYKIQAGSARLAVMGSRGTAAQAHLGGAEVKNIRLRAGEHITDVDLHLTTASAVEGTVKDQEGAPVRSARVECWPSATKEGSRSLLMNHILAPHARSNEDGTFLVGGLEPGSHRVRAITALGISPWAEVRVDANATARAELTVQPGTLLTVNVHESGQPSTRVHVIVSDPSGVMVTSGLLQDGSITLGPLLPDAYVVKARESERKSEATLEVTLNQSGKRTVNLTLD